MRFITDLVENVKYSTRTKQSARVPRVNVGILGTGKIGTDLLLKIMRSNFLTCAVFSGRNLESEGMRYAANLGVRLSDKGIHAFSDIHNRCDIVFDATSAAYHVEHAKVFDRLGILAIDMTPSQIGECCVPALGMVDGGKSRNVSMISCGGQASIPVASVLAQVIPNISALEVSSIASANSIGQGTLDNIDEYYQNTKAGLFKYTQINNLHVALCVDSVNLETPMLTTVIARCGEVDIERLQSALHDTVEKVQRYVPGYTLRSAPTLIDGGVRIDISVEGAGDYLPKYAGNLDIINCAAIAVAEEYARRKLRQQHLLQAREISVNPTELQKRVG